MTALMVQALVARLLEARSRVEVVRLAGPPWDTVRAVIRTRDRRVRAFASSTLGELAEERAAATARLTR